MEATKISCDHNIDARELEETTPIKTLILVLFIVVIMKINVKFSQFTGRQASNSKGALITINTATINRCRIVVDAVMDRIEMVGTPLIL